MAKAHKKPSLHCVQCGEEMVHRCAVNLNTNVPFCESEKCPNYGLLQLGVEVMIDVNKKTK